MDISIFKSAKAALLLAVSATAILLPAIAQAQSYPPLWSSTSHYAIGDQVQLGGNVYRAITAIVNPGSNPSTSYSTWELNYVRSNTTLMIGTGQTFPTVVAAWNYAINARVADGAYLHFYISSANGQFNETFTSFLLLDHNSGPRMALLGDSGIADHLYFTGNNGIVVDSGHSFNTISDMSIEGPSNQNPNVGVKVDSNASISAFTDINLGGFRTGILAAQGGTLSITNCALHAQTTVCLAESGGSIVFPGGFNSAGSGQAFALYATHGGNISAQNSNFSGFSEPVFAEDQGIVDVSNSTITGSSYGCDASSRGYILCYACQFSGNVPYDMYAERGGLIDANASTYVNEGTDNGSGSYIVN
jgi:hypothetical protein